MMCFEKARLIINQSHFLRAILLPCIIIRRLVRDKLFRLRTERFKEHIRRLSLLPEAIFVKVGANDGITGDPCSDLLLKSNTWKGLLIEPVPYCCERLKRNFSDTSRFTVEQVAIGTASGSIPFYFVDRDAIKNLPSLPNWYDQVGSFNRNHITNQFGAGIEPYIVEFKVETCTLSDVFMRNCIADLHLLHIDTEGYDFEVLKMLDFNRYRPVIIFIEHKHLSASDNSAMRRLLYNNGYSIYDCGMDYFAFNKAANKRLHKLQTAHMK